jgi:hypothetical protein
MLIIWDIYREKNKISVYAVESSTAIGQPPCRILQPRDAA